MSDRELIRLGIQLDMECCFAAIYAVRGAGGYQMFGITPMPIFEPDNKFTYFNGEMVFLSQAIFLNLNPLRKMNLKKSS